MKQAQHLAIIAGMLSAGCLDTPASGYRYSRRTPEQNELAKEDRKRKKQQRQNKKRNRR